MAFISYVSHSLISHDFLLMVVLLSLFEALNWLHTILRLYVYIWHILYSSSL